jgi:hypothetical protein
MMLNSFLSLLAYVNPFQTLLQTCCQLVHFLASPGLERSLITINKMLHFQLPFTPIPVPV